MPKYKWIATDPGTYEEINTEALLTKRKIGAQVAEMVRKLKEAGLWVADLGELPRPEGATRVPVLGVKQVEE
jgi:hypothetical protein